jgi:hypothetical protein
LRTLLIVTVVVAAFAGWLGRGIEHNRKQTEIAKTITGMGGYVFYDYQRWNGGWSRGLEPRGPSWLREILGQNFFSELDYVGLSETGVSDDDIPAIEETVRDLGHVSTLDVMRTKISHAGVERLKAALPDCRIDTDR